MVSFGRTQLENLRRDGVPVGLEFSHASPEAVLVVEPTAGPLLVRLAGRPEVVPADIPGDDLRLTGGAPERRIVAEGREQLGTGPSVPAEVCACDRYRSVGLDVRFVAGHVALERTVARGQRVAECHIVPRGGRGESGSLRRTDEEDYHKDEPQKTPHRACHVCSPGEARDSALFRHNPLLRQSHVRCVAVALYTIEEHRYIPIRNFFLETKVLPGPRPVLLPRLLRQPDRLPRARRPERHDHLREGSPRRLEENPTRIGSAKADLRRERAFTSEDEL